MTKDTAPEDEAHWERLCALLDDDAALWPAVRNALEHQDDAWDALLGTLDDAGALAYLDADDSGMELTDALRQLPRVVGLVAQLDLDGVTDTDDLGDALAAADAVLAASGFRLVWLEEPDEDALPLVVVPAAAVAEVLRLAGEVGRRASAVA